MDDRWQVAVRYPSITPFGKRLMQFQQDGVFKMLDRRHNLLADEMGLGKTVQAIAFVNLILAENVLIVCPASIKRNWMYKLREWLTFNRSIQIIDKRTDVVSDLANIVIINYDLISHSFLLQQLTDRKWDVLICDESHRLKNLKTKRTAAVLAKNGLIHAASRSLMMTGTPLLNRPIELYPILRVLAPKVIAPYNTYDQYAKRYCAAWMDGFQLNVQGASHTDELNKKLREHYMIRRLTHEVEVQLPSKRYEVVFVDKTESIDRKLRIIGDATRTDFKYHDSGLAAGEIATLRRETAEAKIDACMEQIETYVESCEKLVIFAYHHSVIEKLEEKLKRMGTITITGRTPNTKRQELIEKFQTDKSKKVFIGQIQAAGEGIDGLQNVCSNVLFVESSWVPSELEQCVKRVHRIGQSKPVLVRFLVWADSIEEHMMRIALDKVKVIKEILK